MEGYKNTHTQTHTHRIHDSFFINHPLFDPFNGTFRHAFAVKKVQNKIFIILLANLKELMKKILLNTEKWLIYCSEQYPPKE